MGFFPRLYVFKISIVMRKLIIKWISLLMMSLINTKVIALMMVGKEESKDFLLIPWVKEGMKKEMKREARNELKK
jgi:hypothetical protein